MDQLNSQIEHLDHISIAVRHIDSVEAMARLMGGTFLKGGFHDKGGFLWAQFVVPGGKIEYVQPATPDCFLHDFLNRRGEGVHHITYKVTDIRRAIEAAQALGFDIVGVDLDFPRWKEAFVHPKSAHGTLIQLAEFEESPPRPNHTFSDVLEAGP